LLAKIRWVLACSCSQNFCNCLSNARARKNKHSARMLVDARKDHSIPLKEVIYFTSYGGEKKDTNSKAN